MKSFLLSMLAAATMYAAGGSNTYTGVITDSMCGANHAMMKISPNEKCVRECVRMDKGRWKYALLVGKDMYVLSDQQTPEQFAARKVTVTGTVYPKTGILKVDKIEPAK
jgi:hypothetical protein